ncbi:hypothetical protein IT575_12255 [bacterium]|nr:hypothetical protein [bacterium]
MKHIERLPLGPLDFGYVLGVAEIVGENTWQWTCQYQAPGYEPVTLHGPQKYTADPSALLLNTADGSAEALGVEQWAYVVSHRALNWYAEKLTEIGRPAMYSIIIGLLPEGAEAGLPKFTDPLPDFIDGLYKP